MLQRVAVFVAVPAALLLLQPDFGSAVMLCAVVGFVLFAAGTGNPYFTTDTAAALRAAEMSCDALFKGTSVDGIYTADPKKVSDAKRYDTVSFGRVLSDDLKVMDAAAVALCRDNNIPIVVFNIRQPGNLAQVIEGGGIATVVQNGE